jgi:hypothetical protein
VTHLVPVLAAVNSAHLLCCVEELLAHSIHLLLQLLHSHCFLAARALRVILQSSIL